jgi:uncharacterized repeat protein (TIGR01451 family)
MSRGLLQLSRMTLSVALGLAVTTAAFAAPVGTVQHPFQASKLPAKTLAAKLPIGQDGRVAVMVDLVDTPAAIDYAMALNDATVPKATALANARAAAKAKVALLAPRQADLAARLTGSPINAVELFRATKALNAIAVRVEPRQIEAIRALPGVKKVRVITPEHPLNVTSVPFIGAPQLWANTLGLPAGATGAGITIGVIDTGLDYQHPMFGGTGALADYQANDRVHISPGLFPTAKVIGGYDFAGDDYTGANTPVPDPNPTDCNNHGSHVAGTAAGYGVNADGTTYKGPYGPTQTPFSSLRIGPGVAPQASLYAIRIFGCGGSTNLTVQGIEFAMDPSGKGDFSDHVDVINMSLGSDFGGLADTSAEAAENAAAIGVIVVSAAGNAGDTYFITGSPGTATHSIAAAAITDSGVPGAVLQVTAPPAVAGSYAAAAAAFGFTQTPNPSGQTGNIVPVASATGTANQGCDGNYTNAAQISGAIALIQRGTCSFQQKVGNAQAAGAIGAIVYNNVPGDPSLISMGPAAATPIITIPSVFISDNDGTALAAQTGVVGILAAANAGDVLASFSSRGPLGGGSIPILLKPDVAAPGVLIPSTQSGMTCTTASNLGCIVPSTSGFIPGGQLLVLSGTSMATPHTAGTMALFKQLHPDWPVEELKALVMNGAVHNATVGAEGSGLTYGLGRVGAGRVDIPTSALNNVTAFNNENSGEVTMSFEGAIFGTVNQVKGLRLVNHASQPATFDLGIDTLTQAPGVNFTLANPGQTSVTVPGNTSIVLPVEMQADASKMDHTADVTVAPVQAAPAPFSALGNLPRQWLTEAGSYLTFSQGGTTKMRVPLYANPRPVSQMAGAWPIATGGAASGTTQVDLLGSGVCTGTVADGACNGNFPLTEASLVTPFELQVNNPMDPTVPGFANIKYVGVSYDATDDLLLFGISTWGPWSSQSDVAFNIFIDTQNNGTFDKIVFNSNPGVLASAVGATANGTDSFISGFLDVASGNLFTEDFINLLDESAADTRSFVNRVMIIPVSPKDLGLAGTSFKYQVETCPGFAPLCDALIDFHYEAVPGTFSWDLANPGLDFGGNFLAFDLAGNALPANFNSANLAANGSLGALLLHTHNVDGSQGQAVPVAGSKWADLGVTSSVAPAIIRPAPNSLVTISLRVTNHGPNGATGVVVSDELPAGLAYVSSAGNGSYDPSTGLWTVGPLNSGKSANLAIKAMITGTGTAVNTAVVAASDLIDPNPANDVSTIDVAAPRLADLAVSATGSKTSQSVTFTVTLTNDGPEPSYNPRVQVLLGGAKLGTATSVSTSEGSFSPSTGIWTLGSIGSGSTQTLQFTVATHRGVGLSVVAIPVTPDPNLHNNSVTITVP